MATFPSMNKYFDQWHELATKCLGLGLLILCFVGGLVIGSPYVVLRFWLASFLALVINSRDLVMIKEST